jgi:plasmid stabilization system protein ParE
MNLSAELSRAIETITSDPLRFEQIGPGIRRCLVNRFPYCVYYRLPDAETVQIVVVKHHSRHPGYGMRRK